MEPSRKPSFEIGLYSFAELTPDPKSGRVDERNRTHQKPYRIGEIEGSACGTG